jgi:uridine kinase
MNTEPEVNVSINRIVALANQLLKAKKPILIALDGRSGAGKSTIANIISQKTGGIIVLGDDFYSGGNDDKWLGYSPKVKADKVIDWRRMRKEVLEPLLKGCSASWHPLDFKPGVGWVGWKEKTITLEPARVIILDGSYSARPELADIVDLSVLVEATDDSCRQRLIAREGSVFMERWHKIWDSAEDFYFSKIRPRTVFDIIIKL